MLWNASMIFFSAVSFRQDFASGLNINDQTNEKMCNKNAKTASKSVFRFDCTFTMLWHHADAGNICASYT